MTPIILGPLTPQAKDFCCRYGHQFLIEGVGSVGLKLNLLAMDVGRRIVVEKRTDGIFVDGEIFCGGWG